MNKKEAIQAMKDGKKLTHHYFGDKEWIKSNKEGTVYEFEDVVKPSYTLFWHDRQSSDWDEGWEVFIDLSDMPFFSNEQLDWELQFD